MSDAVVVGAGCGMVAGVLVAEYTALAPWVAEKMARWAAGGWYARDAVVAAERADEWAALIAVRPGNLLKLGTAVLFGVGAIGLIVCRSARDLGRATRRGRWTRSRGGAPETSRAQPLRRLSMLRALLGVGVFALLLSFIVDVFPGVFSSVGGAALWRGIVVLLFAGLAAAIARGVWVRLRIRRAAHRALDVIEMEQARTAGSARSRDSRSA